MQYRCATVRGLNAGKLERSHPMFVTATAVEAAEVSLRPLVCRTVDEDASTRNDGAAVVRPRQGGLPANVLPRSPRQRRFVLLGDPVPAGATERGPVPRHDGSRQHPKNPCPGTGEPRGATLLHDAYATLCAGMAASTIWRGISFGESIAPSGNARGRGSPFDLPGIHAMMDQGAVSAVLNALGQSLFR
jgi:hypothetical protein